MGLIDFHAHLHASISARTALLSRMDSVGITHSVVVAGGVISPLDLSRQILDVQELNLPTPNRAVSDLCGASEGRLLPFFFANPHEPVTQYQQSAHLFFGLKLGPTVHGIALNDRRHLPYLEVAGLNNHPVYLHCLSRPGFDVAALVEIAQLFPKIVFILGHAGIGNCDFQAVDRIKDQKNIYFETSGGFSSVISHAVKELGADRILFGSEYPLQAPEIELTKMNCVGLSESQLNANAQRALGRNVV